MLAVTNVELAPAITAGVVGGLAMLALQLVGRAQSPRVEFDVLGMWARFLALEGNQAVGLAVHLAVSSGIAVLYALSFGVAGASEAGWAWGLIAGTIHWLIAGLFLGSVPADALGRGRPGPFGMLLGPRGAVGFLLAHLGFGFIVGVTYFALRTA